MNSQTKWIGVVIFTLMVCAGSSMAGVKTWKNNTTGNWSVAVNWNEGAVPMAGDEVVITNTGANVTLSGSTALLGSLTLNKTLMFTNWNSALNVTNVTILTNGTMTLPGPFTNNVMSNNVYIVCANLTVDAGGSINVDARGYSGALANSTAGFGPGAGGPWGGGGGYGGNGGPATTSGGAGGSPYGVADAPLYPGSGSGKYLSSAGHGGGAIRIIAAGTVSNNGTITANGGAGNGGGSGGGIYITCNKLIGTNGIIRANGGSGSIGGGGGGRIAVVYDQAAQSNVAVPTITFSALSGAGSSADGGPGDLGTLWFPDNRFLTETMATTRGQIWGFSSWSTGSLMLNDIWVRFAADGFQLTVTNDVTVMGGSGRLDLGNLRWIDFLRFAGYAICSVSTNSPVLNVGGNLTLTNSGSLHVFSGMTNAATTNYGALVDVTNSVFIATNCWIYSYSHNTNGGSPFFRMGNLFISTNAGFNADRHGFYKGVGANPGYGPGGGKSGVYPGGGGYGGLGGRSGSGYGETCGSFNAPIDPGSGGGQWPLYGTAGDGGGNVRIESLNTITLNGTISAMGQNGTTYSGGGAGGGIYIRCKTLSGSNGILRANGGNTGSDLTHCGGGGGGRVAIEYTSSTFTGSVSVTGGTHINYPGKPGTFSSCQSICLGACSSGCDGVILGADFSKDSGDANATNGVKITRIITTWIPRSKLGRSTLAWSDQSMDLDSNQLDNVATNNLKGLPENTRYSIYDNDVPVGTITSDASGNLSFTVDLTNGVHNILVDHPVR
ncbi:hypothetical protein ACFLQR_02145, partial [Verrucomicrobiota bacterium]